MLTIELHREDGWLRYTATLPELPAHDRERLLAASAALPGNCKAACGPDASLHVQADLPSAWESAERRAAIEAGFAAAAARLGLGATPTQPAAVLPSAPAPDLAALCREVGWPCEERPDGAVSVDLAVPGAYLPALIEARDGCVALESEIVALPAAGTAQRAALVALLLRANGAFRLARAVLRGPEPRAFLEVALPRACGAAELAEALAALAVAARGCAREAHLVAADEAIARVFLERSGMLPPL